jgi:hypothetical protein
VLLLALFVSAVPGAVFAQPPPSTEMARSVSGSWELSNADRDRSCPVILRAAPAPLGLSLQWDAKCAEAFPFTRDTIAWTVAARDVIQFIDRAGKTVLELSEVEGGLYEGERPGEGLVFLQSASSAVAEEKKPEAIAGEWNVAAGGKTICQATLAATPAPKNSFSIKLKPNCDAAITRFAPVGWQIDRGQLLLVPNRGEVWRFEEAETNTWRRIPEGRNPLQLVKQ